MTENIFTDSIKDVIGNSPVLDEFDNAYEASFFGNFQDDYITGSILNEIILADRTKILSSGSRGKLFSKLFSSGTLPLSSDFNSDDVKKNPFLSFREVPWSERVSTTAYRFTQHFDKLERFYDSCLPDLKTCFSVNGSIPWIPNVDPVTQISPHGNIPFTGGRALLFFNSYEMDRTAQGFSKDPFVNNEWTWSFPYENKYEPEKRFLKIDKNLGLASTNLSADWGLGITDQDWALKIENIKILTQSFVPTEIIPILPGYIENRKLQNLAFFDSDYSRNSFRKVFKCIDALGNTTWKNTARYKDTKYDDTRGISVIIPDDVILNRYSDHSFSSSFSNELLTGSMTQEDMIKFLFGFGDLNNLTYGYLKINTSSFNDYIIDFEVDNSSSSGSFSGDVQASNLPSYSDDILSIDWSRSPVVNSWAAFCREGYQTFFDGKNYNYYNAANAPPSQIQESETFGFMWTSSSNPSNSFILKSDTIVSVDGGTMDPGSIGSSVCCLDITSSFPWSIKYRRGVVAPENTYQVKSGLLVYFSGTPKKSSGDLPDGPFQVVLPLEFVSGSHYSIMSEFDSLLNRIDVDPSTPNNPNLFEPGEWRLNFSYIRGIQTDEEFEYGAAIDNLQILVYDKIIQDEDGQKLGANNYPHFRTYKIDTRESPVYSNENGYSQINRDVSKELYKGYISGISPIIRGWKYGLYTGLPTTTRSIWRRNRYGQFRDMLEQRVYTKFIKSEEVEIDNLTSIQVVNNAINTSLIVGPSPVSVNFVKQTYKIDGRNIGQISINSVDPAQTNSYNLSTEVTSSTPYIEGMGYKKLQSSYNVLRNVINISGSSEEIIQFSVDNIVSSINVMQTNYSSLTKEA